MINHHPEWRCTRPYVYGVSCHVEDRQGHYVRAESAQAAADTMLQHYPNEMIDVQKWKNADHSVVTDRDRVIHFWGRKL